MILPSWPAFLPFPFRTFHSHRPLFFFAPAPNRLLMIRSPSQPLGLESRNAPRPRAMHMTVRACVASRISERVHISLRVMYIPPLRMGYSIHFNNWTDNMLTVTWKFMYVRKIWTNYSWFKNTSHYNLVPRVLYYLPGNEVEVTSQQVKAKDHS